MRGWHLVGQAGLDIIMKTIIIGACSTDGTYEEIKELLRITADREEKTETGQREEQRRPWERWE